MSKWPRCEVLPLPDHQVAVLVEGKECLRWHFGPHSPKPFFYPILGPSGRSLTRLGHPGAPNHDHHRSVWFAHADVAGVDFWSDRTPARVVQRQWLAYQDGDEAVLAVLLEWQDGRSPQPLLQQELVAAVAPLDGGQWLLELQSTFRPTADQLQFGRTNFGFLAVRVAKSLSEYFGGGLLTDSNGRQHEAQIFGRRAAWVDYSGPVLPDVVEGLTCFDHPTNPGHPTRWHVREDGWMGASVCFDGPLTTTRTEPLRLRYLLHVHAGPVDPDRAGQLAVQFAHRPPWVVQKSRRRHCQFEVRRAGQ